MRLARATAWALLALALPACGGGAPASEFGVPPRMCSTMAVTPGNSAEMEPGGDCIGCHTRDGAPPLLVGGTVMAALHDDTNCRGVEGALVQLTGADGQILEMMTNPTGNFFVLAEGATPPVFPFQAQVTFGGKTVKMLTAQSDLNCMGCHTAKGAKLAIGRIVPPPP